jgi:hypothetical protein
MSILLGVQGTHGSMKVLNGPFGSLTHGLRLAGADAGFLFFDQKICEIDD